MSIVTMALSLNDGQLDRTRPDTRPSVADGWAGAEMRIFTLFDSCSRTDGPTDGQTDGPMDGHTLIEMLQGFKIGLSFCKAE